MSETLSTFPEIRGGTASEIIRLYEEWKQKFEKGLQQLNHDDLRKWIQKHLVEDENDSGTISEYENAIRLFIEKKVLGVLE